MIEIRHLTKSFGGLTAIRDVNISIAKGAITGLIGPNGAGKTTLFNVIAGNLTPSSGQVLFDDEDVTGLEPYRLFQKGLLRTFQIAHEFPTLSVLENLMVVPGNQIGESLISAWIRPGQVQRQEAEVLEKAREVLQFLSLGHLANAAAGTLSGGQKKLLELGRTMMVDPKIILLDEIGAGINRNLLRDIGTAIERLNRDLGYTFCMIEHDIEFISRLCDPVIVMAKGEVLFEGSADQVRTNREVVEAYLGSGVENRTKLAKSVEGDDPT